ncbi:MAG: N-acetylglucosamine-6-phosphate deacetylase [Shewanella algae]
MNSNTDKAPFWIGADGALLGPQMSRSNEVWLRIVDGRIHTIAKAPKEGEAATHYAGLLVPGFVDTQVNGGGGCMFNRQPSVETLKLMLDAHGRFGTTSMLPTLISDDIRVMQAALAAAISAKEAGLDGIAGIHFEGPHLSLERKGCHSEARLRELGDIELALYAEAVSQLGVCVVTLAPERVGPEDVRRLVALGVRVSLGHSNANAETVMAALDAGASGFTHLYNGMSQLESRSPGMVGTALSDPRAFCGIILDGHHLHPVSATLAWRAKGSRRLMLVTDAMSPVGSEEQEFAFFGGKVVRRGTELRDLNGSLAGSVLEMTTAVRYAVKVLGIPLEQAVAMASSTPAAFAGLNDRGMLAEGMRADLLLLDDALYQSKRWQGGRLAAGAEVRSKSV